MPLTQEEIVNNTRTLVAECKGKGYSVLVLFTTEADALLGTIDRLTDELFEMVMQVEMLEVDVEELKERQ